ncbi:hypothetical protein [Mycolicibacterium litorale]|uniref:hypothetical protein n=1 Tax=Mycolicibacterium litorale TaxID=758802 RepID=UPI001626A578|nr:hypothetical protein [Mycolicibacterium litorale]
MKQAQLRLLGEMSAAQELVDVGLWHPVEGGWEFHDWDEYQETSEIVKKRRDDARERQRRLREQREEQRRQSQRESEGDSPSESRVTADVTNGVTSQPPTRPDPTRPDVATDVATSPSAKPKRAKPRTRISDDFMPPTRVVDGIREEVPGIADEQLRYQHRKFIDHFKKTGAVMADWNAAWRNWMRTANERGEFRSTSPGPSAADAKVNDWLALANNQTRPHLKAIGE